MPPALPVTPWTHSPASPRPPAGQYEALAIVSYLFIFTYLESHAAWQFSTHSCSKCWSFDVSRKNRLNVEFRCTLSTLKSALLFKTKWDDMVHSRA